MTRRYILALFFLPALLLYLAGSSLPDGRQALLVRENYASEEPTPKRESRPGSSDQLAQREERLKALGIAAWHGAGYRGQGVKVAVLDSGFRKYRQYLGRELPDRLAVHSFRADGNLEAKNSQHGVRCAEVVHTYAPAAALVFVNWEPDVPETFLEAVRWAREQGARILTCSLIMPSWSDGDGHGPVHTALAQLLGSGKNPRDLLFFASAGNTAQRHWSGSYRTGANGNHQWAINADSNDLTPWGDGEVSVEMYWKDKSDYDLVVTDRTKGTEAARSLARKNVERTSAVARFFPEDGHKYALRVRRNVLAGRETALQPPASFHIVALGGWLEYFSARGSIPFPGDGADVISVGAVTAEGERLAYSSCGPNSSQPKPELVAPVPFLSLWTTRSFGGTSASAPQAAGMAALYWSRHPEWCASQIRTELERTARDLGPPGHDYETGYGMITMPAP
jgi:subtilisin family serine protease